MKFINCDIKIKKLGGICLITYLTNQKIYIDSSKNFIGRFYRLEGKYKQMKGWTVKKLFM